MADTQRSEVISTRRKRIAEVARKLPHDALTNLAHHMDQQWMQEAFARTRKSGAPGVDGQTAEQYEQNLQQNLQELLNRAKSGSYRAPPVKRVHIPKADGTKRPIGIPTLQDKVLQRAVLMLLEPIYEQEFADCSFGFRPGRSAHQGLQTLRDHLMQMGGGWVLELDIKSFFDTVDHRIVQQILRQRVRDGVVVRLIGKWLNAGVQHQQTLHYPQRGTPQGGVISPLLANIYLHEVLDSWFEQQVRSRLKGEARLVRYADDAVIVFANYEDAQRVLAVMPKRFKRFGLTLHPDKTRLVKMRRPTKRGGNDRGSFDFLGLTHHWARSRRGRWVIKQRTARDRFRRAVRNIAQWLRRHRHDPLAEQHQMLCLKLRGHDQYYGVTGNWSSLARLRYAVSRLWCKWLSRRSAKAAKGWSWFNRLLARFPLPQPRIRPSMLAAKE